MNESSFLLTYIGTATFIVVAIAVWRLIHNWAVLKSQPIEAVVVGLEKDVDIITALTLKIKTVGSLGLHQIRIDPMYDKSNYTVGSNIKVWVSQKDPNMFFITQPNVAKLAFKIIWQSILIWLILCGMLVAFFARKSVM